MPARPPSRWRADAQRRKAARPFQASRRAETGYVTDLRRIMGQVHAGVLQIVREEHLVAPEERRDAKPVGLGDELLRKIVRFTTPQTQAAFDKMAKEVKKSQSRSAAAQAKLEGDLAKRIALRLSLVGIDPPGVDGVIVAARAANVRLITRASEAFLEQVRSVLEENEGERPETIEGLLQERVGVSQSRGELIARDQTLKLNAQVSQHRARAAGLSEYTWSGSLDERERPMHVELEGTRHSFDDPPVTNEDGDTNNPGEDFQCFPGDSELQLAHGVSKAWRRTYSGVLAKLVTASGKVVHATPNHPVLTCRGWVAIGQLQLTDDVLEIADERGRAVEQDEHHRVPSIGDYFGALQKASVHQASRTPTAADFHGDGAEGDVDVVLVARPLTLGVLASGSERRDKLSLAGTDAARLAERSADKLIFGTGSPPHGVVGGSGERQPLLAGHPGHPQQVGRGPSTDGDAGLSQPGRENDPLNASPLRDREQALATDVRFDDGAHVDVEPGTAAAAPHHPVGPHADSAEFLAQAVRVDAEEIGYFVQGLPGAQQFVRVVSVNRLPFSGHVFNLETACGWYAVSGIIAHNCRCVAIPFIEELEKEEPSDDAEEAAE
jgi:SPP1 gp7 family putative phage head morphogenesis protein